MSALDLAVLGAYLAAVLAIGFASMRRNEGPDAWMLAGRNLSGGTVTASLVATELSAATFLGVPAAAFAGDWAYLQFGVGALVAKLLLAWKVIPLYHRTGVTTVYGLLEQRYGPATRRSAAAAFVAGRILASGVRLYIAALALAVVTGLSWPGAILASGVVVAAYTRAAGLRAVARTDALQALVLLLGAVALGATAVSLVPGGFAEILRFADAGGRADIWHPWPLLAWDDTRPLGVAVLGGAFLTLATHSTDHDMVQRLLGARGAAPAGRALVASALLNFPITLGFLFVGTALARFFLGESVEGDRVVATFALEHLPPGLRGLVFAGIFAAAMSSLDSALCAIATTWVVDVRPAAGRSVARLQRTTGAVAVALMGAALTMGAYQAALGDVRLSLVELALSAMTVLYGALLGLFGAALLSDGPLRDRSGPVALAVGALVGLALFLHPLVLGETLVAWAWWIPISALPSFLLARRGGGPRGQGGPPARSVD